jgi:hypothetical protein
MISVVSRKLITSVSSILTSAPITPKLRHVCMCVWVCVCVCARARARVCPWIFCMLMCFCVTV